MELLSLIQHRLWLLPLSAVLLVGLVYLGYLVVTQLQWGIDRRSGRATCLMCLRRNKLTRKNLAAGYYTCRRCGLKVFLPRWDVYPRQRHNRY